MSSVARLQSDICIAPAEVLGTVAHELRQPLSNIESIAYYLSLVLPGGDERVQPQLARIRQLVEQCDWILGSGLRLAAPARILPEPVSCEELVVQAVAKSGIDAAHVRLEFVGELPLVRVDPNQGPAVIEGLLQMLQPMAAAGHPLVLRLSAPREGGTMLEFVAEMWTPQAVLGAGASLMIDSARRIIETHGGSLAVDTPVPESGRTSTMRIVVVLP